MNSLAVMIVDDEPNAVSGLRTILERQGDLEIVATCHSGIEATKQIRRLRPDLVLLDIEMPGMNGFDVISEIGVADMPYVIFVTAYQEFALQAFEVHAFDYILKPIDQPRLLKIIQRVRQQVQARESILSHQRLEALLKTLEAGDSAQLQDRHRLAIKSRGSIIMLPTKDILWIEAAGNYVRFNVEGTCYLSRTTLNNVEERLANSQFVRIHRSLIVNVDRIVRLTPISNVEIRVALDNGKELVASKTFRDRLKNLFEFEN